MNRIGAQILFDALPLGPQFTESSYDLWEAPDFGKMQFIGATTVPGDAGDWTLGVELNGQLGVTRELATAASAGTTLVSHRYNGGNGVGSFRWFEDGELQLGFEPLFAFHRSGSDPDACRDDMEQIGFDMVGNLDDIGPTTPAAFALAERLTGVRITKAMLESAVFLCGKARLPPRQPTAPDRSVDSSP
ncbi:hypothetical protein JGU71_26415 [Antrihabitans sp. YC3-6]|uniref:Uncharacterized protein n=2 Tax=Antrihabitans stalagmiti TaxID=2799499 RepID=A0A934NW71_9NOCA|nr:hypothetical protein [Antrihabitans stalagmiti]